MAGRHNMFNAMFALGLAHIAEVDLAGACDGISSFAGVRRRFELREGPAGGMLVNDYAHHPAEIEAVVGTARRRFPGQRLLVVFQPHQYQRTLFLLDEFALALAAADSVLVTAGAQQALDLVLRSVCSPGDTVVVTTPSYHHMHGLLRAHGLQVVQVPFGPDGLDHAQLSRVLSRSSVRLCYLMPTFHNPTGRSLNLVQRQQLMAALADTDVAVVEDEYQHSLRCRGEALPTLRSLDARGLTVTVSTVSKELFPALRIGWIAGSEQLLEPMAAVKGFMDLETSPLLQAALAEFIRSGCFDKHLASLRTELQQRHLALQAACSEHLPSGCRITNPDGGFVAWLELPGEGQGDKLAELAVDRGVRVVPGRAFDLDGAASRGVRLSLTRANTKQIYEGVRVLAECARELLEVHAPAQTFL